VRCENTCRGRDLLDGLGALIRYEASELAREWCRLEKLPEDQFDNSAPRIGVEWPLESAGQMELFDFSNRARPE
jgi:hypothetical protein